MHSNLFIFRLLMLEVCLLPQAGYPCTTFCLDKGDQLVVGFNMDWIDGQGTMVVNKRHVSKTAYLYLGITDCQPVNWTSKYGSVTFAFGGRDFPLGGMNEAGLVIHLLKLYLSKYPPPDSRQCISPVQWVQYQLDNFDKVEQVIATDSQIRIIPPPAKEGDTHYFICDSTGNCAVIEFLDGKTVYYTKGTLPVKALTNDRYDDCISDLDKYKSWGGDLPTPQSSSWHDRFIKAADMVKNYAPGNSKTIFDYAFKVLADVKWSVPVITQWSIVYDLKKLHIRYRTIDNKQIRYVDLNSFDFSCKSPVKLLDVNADLSGDITKKFIDYSYERNRDNIEKVFNFPEAVLNAMAQYPESTVCADE